MGVGIRAGSLVSGCQVRVPQEGGRVGGCLRLNITAFKVSWFLGFLVSSLRRFFASSFQSFKASKIHKLSSLFGGILGFLGLWMVRKLKFEPPGVKV